MIVAFLGQGYNVRATAANVSNTPKTYQDQIQLAILPDVSVEGAFTEAVKGVDGVSLMAQAQAEYGILRLTGDSYRISIHAGATDYENDLFRPAVNGTISILSAVQQHNAKVERIVITSAFTAMLDPSKGLSPGFVYTDKDWDPVTREGAVNGGGMVVYLALKTLAELAAREFVLRENSTTSFLVRALSLHAEAEHIANYTLTMGSVQHIQRIKVIYPFLKTPIIVSAPMRVYAGPRLAVAVSNAGGLGFIGPVIRPT